jgi:hypothetical protein
MPRVPRSDPAWVPGRTPSRCPCPKKRAHYVPVNRRRWPTLARLNRTNDNSPRPAFLLVRGRLCTCWRVKDSNLRSFATDLQSTVKFCRPRCIDNAPELPADSARSGGRP